jgi:hypothetical protein
MRPDRPRTQLPRIACDVTKYERGTGRQAPTLDPCNDDENDALHAFLASMRFRTALIMPSAIVRVRRGL